MICAARPANEAKFRAAVPSIDTVVMTATAGRRMPVPDSDELQLPGAHFGPGRETPKSGARRRPEVHDRLAAVRAAAYAEAGGQKDSFMCRRRSQARISVGVACFNEILLKRP
jgi:hypothetical protein